MKPFTETQNDRFESFAASFRRVFHRADQFLRFRAYLRGLLEPGEKKNFEGIAAAAKASIMVEQDLPQALQHFVTSSPWDSQRLLSALRESQGQTLNPYPVKHLIHEQAFVKKGKHSVGVQRQYARNLGQKLNCQVGVFLSTLSNEILLPLDFRLYLPQNWLVEQSELAEKLIPEPERKHFTKAEIARKLIETVLTSGCLVKNVAYEMRSQDTDKLEDWLKNQGIEVETTLYTPAKDTFTNTMSLLGLDHYEGRSWIGWHHHAAIVITAYYFLISE